MTEIKNIYVEHEYTISTFIVPWIMGKGCKNSEQAKTYLKNKNDKELLNPNYYQRGNNLIDANDEKSVFLNCMKCLFNDDKLDTNLSELIGEKVYKPWDCLSGYYKIEINNKLGLIAYINGITKNNTIIMVDDYINNKKMKESTKEEKEILLICTMAVWEADKCIYFYKKLNETICLNFDQNKWFNILVNIKQWATSIEEVKCQETTQIKQQDDNFNKKLLRNSICTNAHEQINPLTIPNLYLEEEPKLITLNELRDKIKDDPLVTNRNGKLTVKAKTSTKCIGHGTNNTMVIDKEKNNQFFNDELLKIDTLYK